MVVGGCLCAATGAFFCEAGAVSLFFEKGDPKPLVGLLTPYSIFEIMTSASSIITASQPSHKKSSQHTLDHDDDDQRRLSLLIPFQAVTKQ